MITLINKTDVYEYYGLSTDTKPLNAPNASVFFEIDNQKIYLFDAQNQTWYEFIDLGG